MSEKNLPIKFFQKRQKDESNTEGGGGGNMPKWVNPQMIGEKASYMRGVLKIVSQSLSEKVKKKNFIPSVIRLKVNEDALAKSYRKDIGSLFNLGKLNTIGFNGEDEVLVKVDNEEDLQAMILKFSNIGAYPSNSTLYGISAIVNAEVYSPQIQVSFSYDSVLKIKLFNYGSVNLNSIVVNQFEEFCKRHNIIFDRSVYSAELNIYRLSRVSQDSFNELKDFDGVQVVTEMPVYEVAMDVQLEDHDVEIKYPVEGKEYPVIGVLDSGISNIPHLAPWMYSKNFSKYHSDDIDKSHGTFVAGVLLYGDNLEGKEYTGFNGCKLFEAIVFPNIEKQKIYEDELIEHIREAIGKNDEVKIWNLSLGTENEADLNEFSDFAKALDEIQEQHEVLICKSAGNCNNFKSKAPTGRISKSADTVRGLVVGSMAHEKGVDDFADKNNPSPFSRIGPGPAHLIKPDVIHVGGNAGLNSRNNPVFTTVRSFAVNGGIAKRVGTSFATPRVAAIAAGLDSMLNERFNPLLLKALIIHSARYPEEMKMSISDKINGAGFGVPSNINEILFNQQNEITLILQDTIEKGTFIDILDFPFPQSMVDENGFFYGEVTVTLVTSPILESSQGAEYCQSNIDVMFGSYDTKTERDTSKPLIKNPIGADNRKNVLSTAVYSKKASQDNVTAFATERMLVSYGDKYQPVKKWGVNFDDFTNANKEKYLKAPKNWYLKLEGLFRNFTEEKCEISKVTPSQEFCLIITIKDTKKRGNIYNEVTQLLDSFSFIHSNIKIKDEVRVRLNH